MANIALEVSDASKSENKALAVIRREAKAFTLSKVDLRVFDKRCSFLSSLGL